MSKPYNPKLFSAVRELRNMSQLQKKALEKKMSFDNQYTTKPISLSRSIYQDNTLQNVFFQAEELGDIVPDSDDEENKSESTLSDSSGNKIDASGNTVDASVNHIQKIPTDKKKESLISYKKYTYKDLLCLP